MGEMNFLDSLIVFGPVPSRRLGRSLGVNNIPPKKCSYSCVYCQIGRTLNFSSERKPYYRPEEIFSLVKARTDKIIESGEKLDYITFVPDGEPTLDINLGAEIESLKPLGFKTAVITNSSLITDSGAAEALMKADLVCLKADAVYDDIWVKINRPAGKIKLDAVLDGIINFSKAYKGVLITDTMLVGGINDGPNHMKALSGYLAETGASKNYISVITRPPAEEWVERPSEENLNAAFQAVEAATGRAELNIGYEGDDFSFMGNAEKDLLGIISVHPMREDAVKGFLEKAGSSWRLIDELARRGDIVETFYGGSKFYVRKIKRQ